MLYLLQAATESSKSCQAELEDAKLRIARLEEELKIKEETASELLHNEWMI